MEVEVKTGDYETGFSAIEMKINMKMQLIAHSNNFKTRYSVIVV